MKTRYLCLAAIGLNLLAGCKTAHDTRYSTVMEGMTRNNLRFNFGEPLRIQPATAGGEDWYYRFSSWQSQPTGSANTNDNFGEPSTAATIGLEFSKHEFELPVHVSPEGFVVPPIPKGKVVRD